MVGDLLELADMKSANLSCLSVDEFAEALERVQAQVGLSELGIELRELDVHYRPQQFYMKDIAWDIVLDVADVAEESVLKPIRDRMRYSEIMPPIPPHRHKSTGGKEGDKLMPSEMATKRLSEFARESVMGELKYKEKRR